MKAAHLVLAAVLVPACGQAERDPPGPLRDCGHTIFFQPGAATLDPSVVGDFNDFTPGLDPLHDDDGDGVYTGRVAPPPGTHLYRIQADNEFFLDPYNPLTLFDADGIEHSVLRTADCGEPALEVVSLQATPEGGLSLTLRFLRATSGAPLDPASVEATLEDGRALPAAITAPGDISVSGGSIPAGKHRVRIAALDASGVSTEPLSLPFWVEAEPFDWRDAVIYQVMVDRFRRGTGSLDAGAGISHRHGGDLDGVTAALSEGYFEELGVNVLWLSPLYENPEGEFTGRDGHPAEAYHGYWPAEPRAVEERFGGTASLDRLVAEAHARGIRVLMDAVPNHVHEEHPYHRDHLADGWFNHPEGDCICGTSCPWGTHIEDCWFDPFLPDLAFEKPEVVEQVVEDSLWWLERFHLDGFRVDAVPMMPRLLVRHLREGVRTRLEAGGTPVYLLGETYTSRGGQPVIRWYLGPHSLSGQFDFPVMWALRNALAGRIPMTELDDEVVRSERAWEGSGSVMAPILGNHDVPRFLSEVNGDVVWLPRENPPARPERDKPYELLKIAWTFLLTQPGAPVIYYGDEIGLPGGSDPDNRRDMRFGTDLVEREGDVLEHVRSLGRARAGSLALRRGSRRTLLVHDNLYVYGRDAGDGRPAVVALNRATVPRDVTVRLPGDWELAGDLRFVDLWGAPATTSVADRSLSFGVAPRGSAVLIPGGSP